jgi:hypothetical protein
MSRNDESGAVGFMQLQKQFNQIVGVFPVEVAGRLVGEKI